MILVLLRNISMRNLSREDLPTVVVKHMVWIFFLHYESVLVDDVMVR